MTILAAALAGIILLLAVALVLEHQRHTDLIALLWQKAEAERRSLLDRIQHPTVRQVEPAEYEPPPPARDAAEFAHIGGVVPDNVHVGSEVADAQS